MELPIDTEQTVDEIGPLADPRPSATGAIATVRAAERPGPTNQRPFFRTPSFCAYAGGGRNGARFDPKAFFSPEFGDASTRPRRTPLARGRRKGWPQATHSSESRQTRRDPVSLSSCAVHRHKRSTCAQQLPMSPDKTQSGRIAKIASPTTHDTNYFCYFFVVPLL